MKDRTSDAVEWMNEPWEIQLNVSEGHAYHDLGIAVVTSDIHDEGVPIHLIVRNDTPKHGTLRLRGKSCGCLVAEQTEWQLRPNRSVTITIQFQMIGRPTPFRHYLDFAFEPDAGETTDLLLTTDGVLLPEAWSNGALVSSFDEIDNGQLLVGTLSLPLRTHDSKSSRFANANGRTDQPGISVVLPEGQLVPLHGDTQLLVQPIVLKFDPRHIDSYASKGLVTGTIAFLFDNREFARTFRVDHTPFASFNPAGISITDRADEFTAELRINSRTPIEIAGVTTQCGDFDVSTSFSNSMSTTTSINFRFVRQTESIESESNQLLRVYWQTVTLRNRAQTIRIPVYVWDE